MNGIDNNKLDRGGVIAALAAFTFWGGVPIYYQALGSVDPWEVLAHRVIWSIPILVVFLIYRDGPAFWKRLRLPISSIAWLTLSGLMISVNWVVFVWAVGNGHILDTSLGYFLTPLFNVILGYFVLKERLTTPQYIGVGIAAIGTIYLAWFLGRPPWISITLAISFGLYGLLRKRLAVGPLLGLLWETSLMLTPALVYLLLLAPKAELKFLQGSTSIDLLLMGSGLATILPLVWFNMAAQKLPLSILGFFQYIGPSLSFLVAVFMFNESFSQGHAVAFSCIWLALVLVSIEPFRRARKRLRG